MVRKHFDLLSLPSEPPECRLGLASDAKTPPEVLEVLSRDHFWFVRDRVAANISTPQACLQQLLQDPDFRVQMEAERTLERQAALEQHRNRAGNKAPLTAQISQASGKALDHKEEPGRHPVPDLEK